jgi:hypothetical protein
MVAIIDPFLIRPSDEQRAALEVAAGYLSRASTHAATRLMTIHDSHPGVIEMTELADSLDRAAMLLRSMAEMSAVARADRCACSR